MSYQVAYKPAALADLARLSPPLQQYVECEADRLAADPLRLARRAAFPFPATGQMYEPDPLDLDGELHYFVILFRFSQDETTLIVTGVGHHVSG